MRSSSRADYRIHRDPEMHGGVYLTFSTRPEKPEVLSQEIAVRLQDEPITYVLACGPSYGVAYALAMCYLQEMQWMHAATVHAGEFFHGAFEVVTDDTPLLVLLDESEARPIAERALQFSEHMARQFHLTRASFLSREPHRHTARS